MNIGKLRHRVTIQKVTVTQDADTGEVSETWSTLGQVWAEVAPLSGRELFAAQQVEAQVSHQVTTRYRGDVTPNMRISHNSRTLNIESVINPGERNRELQLLCTEVAQ